MVSLCLKVSVFCCAVTKAVFNMPRAASVYRVLNVAEKNDAAKRIANILSNNQVQRREGFSQYNKIYEFDYPILGNTCKMVMTSLSGHLLNYEFAGAYRKWTGCHPTALFDAEIEKCATENMLNIKKTLEKEIRSCQALVVWTDCDREGENIGFEIIDTCQRVKPNIVVHRAKFSEITERSVKYACQNFVQPDSRVSDAVDVRQELDLRIGAAFTRFQTLRLQKVFPNVLSDKLISYGSCQFPTLGFVVERYKAREEFQSETFHKIEVTHTTQQDSVDGETLTTSFSWKRHRLFNRLACEVLYLNCIEPPAVATVTDVTGRPKSRWRPVALDTVEFEKLASRKLRITAKEAMKVAEKLYTQGYISYPRTETNIFPKDINLQRLIQEQTPHPIWGGFAQRLLQIDGGPTPRNGNKTDKAHPPIHPTKYTNSLSGDEARLYELIVRHFLACCHRDAQGHETTVEIELGGEKFSAQGLMIIAKNYLEIYIYDKWNAKVIPAYSVGDEFEPTTLRMTDGQTTAPPLLTEADLISLMDKHGIGTDATHAEHIETIKQRSYVGLTSDNRFLPGELGMGLVEGYNLMGHQMSRPELRAELEADLKKICAGEISKDEVRVRYIEKYRHVFLEAVRKATKLDESLSVYFGNAQTIDSSVLNPSETSAPIRPCPHCGKDMVVKKRKDGGFLVSCMGYPTCRCVAFLPKSVLDVSVDDSVCPTCRPSPVHRVRLKLRRGSVPAYFQSDQVLCIGGCDEDVNYTLGIRYRQGTSTIPPTSNQRAPPARQGRSHSTGSGAGPGFLNSRRQNGPKRPSAGKRKMSTTANRPAASRLRAADSEDNNLPGNSAPNCACGITARMLTVRKDGPNTGRNFYKCGNGQGGCDFFEWADAAPLHNRSHSNPVVLPQQHNDRINDAEESGSEPQGLTSPPCVIAIFQRRYGSCRRVVRTRDAHSFVAQNLVVSSADISNGPIRRRVQVTLTARVAVSIHTVARVRAIRISRGQGNLQLAASVTYLDTRNVRVRTNDYHHD